MMTDPTPGELLRRIDDVVRRFERAEAGFQTRELANAQHATLRAALDNLASERKSDVEWRRQVQLTLGALAVTVLVSIALAAVGLLSR